jgi:small subunit ribosomal protein S20
MMRVSERRRLRNRVVKSSVRTYVRGAERGISDGAETVDAMVVTAIQALDKAASKGVLHAKNAARRKSRLMKKLNASKAVVVQEVVEVAKPARRARTTRAKKS